MVLLALALVFPTALWSTFDGPIWTASGSAEEELFGQTVATAGDVNGDGFDDVVIANEASPYSTVYVFLGSIDGLAAAPAWERNGLGTGIRASITTSAAGDVNGDGFDDIVVGAPNGNGIAYLYHGTADGPSTIPAWSAVGGGLGANYGAGVSSAGDVDADGYDDILIGASGYGAGGGAGAAYLYRGSALGVVAAPTWVTSGVDAHSKYGGAVAAAGDVNGDGYDDVIIGAPGQDSGFISQVGAAWVYHGSPTGLQTSPAWTVVGTHGFAQLGAEVAGAGDVNGDGYDDVLVAEPFYSAGIVYLYLGSASGLSSTPAWTRSGSQSSSRFGYSVASLGDMNGDGRDDVIIGEPLYAQGWGRVVIYYGSSSGLFSTPQHWFNSPSAQAEFGSSVATAGNVYGSATAEFIVGAPKHDSSHVGAAYLYRKLCGDSDGDGFEDCTLCGGSICGDCDDEDRTRYPNSPEINDGQDNQCPGAFGSGSIDEVEGGVFADPSDRDSFSWVPQAGATEYEVAQSIAPDFSSQNCMTWFVSAPEATLAGLPAPGGVWFYLVRATRPNTGSWGVRSDQMERTAGCAAD